MNVEVNVDETDRTDVCVRCLFWGATADNSGFEPTSCNHSILPLSARYKFAELDIEVSFSLEPEGTPVQVSPDKTTGEFTTKFWRSNDLFGRV